MSEGIKTGLEIADEFAGVDLGDLRLNRRLLKIASALAGCPTGSIPAATDGRAEMEAAYRFFDNAKVTPADVLAPHREATLQRIRQCNMVVLAQDTTEMELTRPTQQVEGAGPLTSEKRRGSYYHPLMAFNLENLCLGTVWNKHWVREKIHVGRSEADKQRAKLSTPIEDKESMRWIEGIRAGREVAQACPQTTCVCVSDSESDIYELFAEPLGTPSGNDLHLVIRACRDRKLLDGDSKIDDAKLFDAVRKSECLYRCVVDVSSRKAKPNAQRKSPRTSPRDARTAKVEVRALSVTLAPPSRPDRTLPSLKLNVILVEEPNPPEGQEPIQWLLLTTLPISTIEEVQRVVACYCIRWQIEITQAECVSRTSLYRLAA
ncbi:IS4 family transposase [Neorhodopirellula pilleata]|uniref:Transposase for transposon Tn5 n=1 Tax=Neorhodopirellula pilleata TaxID=2714738 RepID=A0A5C6ADP2_9BACT|nr:IS4 family transposase [Neorhodopirellula pilleata]TWT97418.1 Transposase for transposon Tn5 [Neorhodopirellula pilleata]